MAKNSPGGRQTIVLAVALFAAAAAPLRAQDTALTRILVANRHPIGLAAGHLDGAGGRLLVGEGRRSRFFLVGEEHGVAQIPQLVQALLTELRPAGYNTLAIEISPLQGQRLDSIAHHPGASDALSALLAPWYSTVPFYSVAEEHALLDFAVNSQGTSPPMQIWGLDYDISADRFYLDELEQLAPASGKAAVHRARELAERGFVAVSANKDPSKLFAWSAPDSVFDALRAAFGNRLPGRVRAIIELFETTARINRAFLGGDNYGSNQMRAAFLRANLIKAFAAAARNGPVPHVLFKFGSSHLMRGFNASNMLDLGTAATMLADARGERAFNLMIVGGSGGQAARMNIMSLQYEPAKSGEIDGAPLAWLKPAVPESGWVLFDMRAVRAELFKRGGPALSAAQDRMLHAFDAIAVLTGSTAGTPGTLVVR